MAFKFLLLFFLLGSNAEERPSDCFLRSFSQYQVIEEKHRLQNLETLLQDQKDLDRTIKGLHLVDFEHSVDEIMLYYLGHVELSDLRAHQRYDKTEIYYILNYQASSKQPLFENFLKVRAYYKNRVPFHDLDTLKQTHAIMMSGIDGLKPEEVGKFRDLDVFGNFDGDQLRADQMEALKSNPYLGYVIYDQIKYVDILNSSEWVIEKVKRVDPELAKMIKTKAYNYHAQKKELIPRFIEALVKERVERYFSEIKKNISFNNASDIESFLRKTADLYKDLISIHPFPDGNGRTIRAYINGILEEHGFPSFRLLDPNDDLHLSQEAFQNAFMDAVLHSIDMQKEIVHRIEYQMPIQDTSFWVMPHHPRFLPVDLKKQNSSKVIRSHRWEDIFYSDFSAFVRLKLEDPKLRLEFVDAPVDSVRKYVDEYQAVKKGKVVDYHHEKRGDLKLELYLIDPDFEYRFFRVEASNKKFWKNKIDTWYSEQELMWRGLARTQGVKFQETEILSFFTQPMDHMRAQNISSRFTGKSKTEIQSMIQKEFKRYNQEFMDGSLVQTAMDHSRTGPRYPTSWGYSCSDEYQVAKAFGMGAMVVADYGKHMNPEAQKRVVDRIVVGAYKSKKDLELNTLKQLIPEYSNKYPRQKEILGVGASDPDSIMVVHRLDEKGEVIDMWVRDRENPDLIYYFQHEVKVSETGEILDLHAKPLKTYQINSDSKIQKL